MSLDLFKKGDRVRVQDIKTRNWTTKGAVVLEVYHEGAQAPLSYFVDSDEGGRFLRNGKYIQLLNGQSNELQEPEPQGTDDTGVGLRNAHASNDELDSRESADTTAGSHRNIRGYETDQGPKVQESGTTKWRSERLQVQFNLKEAQSNTNVQKCGKDSPPQRRSMGCG